MLVGNGIDIIRISRVQQTLDRYGERFLSRVFTAAEAAYCRSRRNPAASLAARFAAKEACFKAVGGTRRPFWREIEVVRGPNGKPSLRLHGSMARRHPAVRFALALSHDGDQAVASVMAEARIPNP
jgi:holo-[acyl-carrier protein] synthase